MSDKNEDAGGAGKKRNRSKADYLIQKSVAVTNGASAGVIDGWSDIDTEPLVDTAAAVKHLRDKGMTGKFRIVAVKRLLTIESVQTTTLKIT